MKNAALANKLFDKSTSEIVAHFYASIINSWNISGIKAKISVSEISYSYVNRLSLKR